MLIPWRTLTSPIRFKSFRCAPLKAESAWIYWISAPNFALTSAQFCLTGQNVLMQKINGLSPPVKMTGSRKSVLSATCQKLNPPKKSHPDLPFGSAQVSPTNWDSPSQNLTQAFFNWIWLHITYSDLSNGKSGVSAIAISLKRALRQRAFQGGVFVQKCFGVVKQDNPLEKPIA